MRFLYILLGILAFTFGKDEFKSYDGYRVIRTYPETRDQYEALHVLSLQGYIEFLSDLRRSDAVDILVSPFQLKRFKSHMRSHGIPFETTMSDVGKIIAEQRLSARGRRLVQASAHDEMNWDDYHRLSVINEWLKDLEIKYPNLVSVESIGQSSQGRNISLVKISTGGTGEKAGVYIDGNMHAREWISLSTVTYVINELIQEGSGGDLLTSYDFYLVPSVNPDGYEYTHTWDRMWRKTMSEHDKGQLCFGVDGNRNWDYMWGEVGGSPEKCHYQYIGPSPFSEPETSAVQKFILNTHVNWTYFLTLHNFGQYVLIPYGDGSRPNDFDELLSKGNAFVSGAHGVDGTVYVAGNSREVLYTTSGTSSDWAKGVANIKYSYTVELRDKGDYAFLVPPSLIKVIGQEFWTGLKAMLLSS